MKLTTRSEYGLLAMLHLARQPGDAYVSVEDIAAARGIPRRYLEQILSRLKQSRCVKSRKGLGGGYRLAKPPKQITLAEVVRLLDGALAPTESVSRYFYVHTPIEDEPRLRSVFREIRDHAAKKLEGTTLHDVA